MSFSELRKKISQNPEFDLEKIEKAYQFAKNIHASQKRKSGEPFIIHPIEVAQIVYEIGGDENMICAALLHDVLEDADNPEQAEEKIHEIFGQDIFFLVHAISKDIRIEDRMLRQEEYTDRLEKLLKMDIAVFFLKMADLLHNMKTIQGLPPEKREKWIHELKNTYLPMMSEHFHSIALPYHTMYRNLIDQLESVISEYEEEKITSS
ncbi:HD domain-containing protein [Candidatus Gracilibacteria bacterium]|nr:HD domain-containing protein [Candidatus Gracilibacteria bacterium]MCF7819538.1 HD domain-containing protein [Candidatus Gracilibacteria bacterium]